MIHAPVANFLWRWKDIYQDGTVSKKAEQNTLYLIGMLLAGMLTNPPKSNIVKRTHTRACFILQKQIY